MPVYDMVKIFKALSDKTRQDILELLSSEAMNVSDICEEFDISQPTVSHHLKILKECELVKNFKRGKSVYYEVRQEIISDFFGTVIRKMKIRIIREK